jgi:hypothetical protein
VVACYVYPEWLSRDDDAHWQFVCPKSINQVLDDEKLELTMKMFSEHTSFNGSGYASQTLILRNWMSI